MPTLSPSRQGQPTSTGDRFGRPLRHLRLSVTDRCNFRCIYCMPRDRIGPGSFTQRESWLSVEAMGSVVAAMTPLGLRRVRLTGGEPLLRPDLGVIVRAVRSAGVDDVAVTTNGSLLEACADELAASGVARVTVSLDSLEEETHRAMSDSSCPVPKVLAGIGAAARAGLHPIKVNTVVQRGLNDRGVLDLVRHFRGTGVTVRFIEYMDVGSLNHWARNRVVPSRELRDRIDAVYPLEEVEREPGGVALRFRFRDGAGEVGFIASVTDPFCGTCDRARISVDGRLHTCLFATHGHDLNPHLARGEEELTAAIAAIWHDRRDRYSEQRGRSPQPRRRLEMYRAGG